MTGAGASVCAELCMVCFTLTLAREHPYRSLRLWHRRRRSPWVPSSLLGRSLTEECLERESSYLHDRRQRGRGRNGSRSPQASRMHPLFLRVRASLTFRFSPARSEASS